MKAFVRWGATLGLVGSTLLGSSFIGNLAAIALPPDQVAKTLESVPVFTITDDKGAPLVRSVKNEQNKNVSVAGVFVSQRDAQSFIDQLKKENPDLARQVRVSPVSLGEVYKIGEANQNKPDRLNFAFVPMQQQVTSALALLRQSGQQVQDFQGVPLFVAKAGPDQGYLTIQEGNKQIIPFFFEKEQLQGMVDNFKKQKPELARTVKIEVVNLQGVLQALRNSNSPQLNNIVLVPPKESLDFLRKLPSSPRPNQSTPRNQPQRRR